MALSNYTELKASIGNWLNRSDLATEIQDDFIKLTEADLNSKLRIRSMISQSTFNVTGETADLPTGFLQVRDLYILSGGTKFPLRYMTPTRMDQVKGTSQTGLPQAYTILGDTFRFMPKPDSTYSVVLNFYKRFDPLSTTNTSNFILTNHPAIYLYGSLFHAANFIGGYNPQQVQTWQQMFATALERLEQNDREDQFSGSPLQTRSEDTVSSPFKSTSINITNSA